MGADEYVERLEYKKKSAYSFVLKYSKITVSNKTYSHDYYTSSFLPNVTNLTEVTPLIHGILNPVHNGLIIFIFWIGYKVHRAVVRTLKRLGSRHINTIILASIVSEDSIQCNFRLLALKLIS